MKKTWENSMRFINNFFENSNLNFSSIIIKYFIDIHLKTPLNDRQRHSGNNIWPSWSEEDVLKVYQTALSFWLSQWLETDFFRYHILAYGVFFSDLSLHVNFTFTVIITNPVQIEMSRNEFVTWNQNYANLWTNWNQQISREDFSGKSFRFLFSK